MALPVQKVIFNCRKGISSSSGGVGVTDVVADAAADAGTPAPLNDFLGWAAKPSVPVIRRLLRSSSGIDRLAKEEQKILMVVIIVGTKYK
jgi:hypothetical protein